MLTLIVKVALSWEPGVERGVRGGRLRLTLSSTVARNRAEEPGFQARVKAAEHLSPAGWMIRASILSYRYEVLFFLGLKSLKPSRGGLRRI